MWDVKDRKDDRTVWLKPGFTLTMWDVKCNAVLMLASSSVVLP